MEKIVGDAYRLHIDQLRRPLELLSSRTPEDQELKLELNDENGVARLIIKSGAKNALSGRMISQLTELLDKLERWKEGKALLIYGHGKTFCSGSDLIGVRETASQQGGLQLAQVMQYNLMRLQCLPMVSVAFIEGYALGGGAELALAADLRLMTASAKIGFVHVKVGVCCGWGGGKRLLELLGPARSLELLTSGRLIQADEAKLFGLSNGTCDSLDEALAFTLAHAVGPCKTLKALKCMVNSIRLGSKENKAPDSCAQIEGQLFASTWGQPDHLEALERNGKHRE